LPATTWGTNIRGEGMNSWLRFLAILMSLILIGSPAAAHPHVWVVLKSQLIYDKAGLVTGVRHVWTFDDVYSAFLIQGLRAKRKGSFTREELASTPRRISTRSKTMTISRKRPSTAARPLSGRPSNIGLSKKMDR
jgi:ABC-type uncharacterized transport system substrate-binding protein